METRNMLAIALIVIVSCFSATVSAQNNLNALMEKCGSMDDVDMNVVQQRDPATKKITQIIKTVKFTNKKVLVDDFLKAFQADKGEAFQAIESKKNGKMLPSYYQFNDKGMQISYTIKVSGDGAGASVVSIQNGE